jgi:hypothetical protein
MKLLYKTEYVERVIFVIEHKGKVIFVYRSSGLSGTGYIGNILPFMYLNDRNTISSTMGYIFKEMRYNGRYQSHYKEVSRFEGLSEKMNQIKEFLKDETAEVAFTFEEGIIWGDFKKFIQGINKELSKLEKQYGLFDLADEF